MLFRPSCLLIPQATVVQNNLDRRDAVFASSEFLTKNLTYFTLIDANYRGKGVGSDSNVDLALIQVYSAMLRFAAEVQKARDENAGSRIAKSIFSFSDSSLAALKEVVKEQKEALKEWQQLAADLDAEQEKQLKWVSSFDFSNRHKHLHERRTEGTGTWLLDSPEHNFWVYNEGEFLWLPGISGCGKSVLCSTVIHELKNRCKLDRSKYVAYWYFEFGKDETKSVDAVARSLIRQLSKPPLASSVVNLYKGHCYDGSQPDYEDLLTVLHDVLSKFEEGSHVYLIFDALDECPNNDAFPSQREKLLSLFVDLLGNHKNKVHILATSRPEEDIREELSEYPSVDLELRLAGDVKKFVDNALSKGCLRRWKDPEVHKAIRDKLLSFKERRFRWAELQIDALAPLVKKDKLIEALDKVPATLEDTYRRVLDSIPPDNVSTAREILMILCLSPTAVNLDTVAQMADIDNSGDVVTTCTSSLVTLNQEEIQVAHFSVQEYLIVDEKESKLHECQFTATDGHKHLTERAVDCLLA
ncbi:hypothetical protein N7524_011780 [Penicillium chrysogenum]|nr:hypothetical protein N7524_011780 [Penicillium chrysogenum]